MYVYMCVQQLHLDGEISICPCRTPTKNVSLTLISDSCRSFILLYLTKSQGSPNSQRLRTVWSAQNETKRPPLVIQNGLMASVVKYARLSVIISDPIESAI